MKSRMMWLFQIRGKQRTFDANYFNRYAFSNELLTRAGIFRKHSFLQEGKVEIINANIAEA